MTSKPLRLRHGRDSTLILLIESNMGSRHEKTLILLTVLTASTTCYGWPDDAAPTGDIFHSNIDTGSPAIAPPWSMKPWFWEDDVNTAEAVWDLVNGCRDHELPLGAVLIDSPWATAYNSFRFDEKRYPHPRGMIGALHARDVRVVLWMTNVINTRRDRADAPGDDEALYTTGKARGYFVNDGARCVGGRGRAQ